MASSSRNRLFGNFDVQLMVFLPVASLGPQLHTLLSSPSIGACPLCLVWLLKKVETVRSVLPHAASHHQHVLNIDMDVYFVRYVLLSFVIATSIPHICHRRHGRRPCKLFLAGVNFFRFNAKNWQFTV